MKHNLFIAFTLAAAPFPALAQTATLDEWKQASVQIISRACDRQAYAEPFFASGFAIKQGGKTVILSSEHAIVQSAGGSAPLAVCAEIRRPGRAPAPARVVAVSYELGLAALEPSREEDELGESAIDFDGAAQQTLALGSPLRAVGYPASSSDLRDLAGGVVRDVSSMRAFLPGVRGLIEASGLPIEFGMSGGAAIAPINNVYFFAGVASHQFLRREAGQRSSTERLTRASEASSSDLAFVIPAPAARAWLASLAGRVAPTPDWERDGRAQLEGNERLIYRKALTLEAVEIDASEAFASGAFDGGDAPESYQVAACHGGLDGCGTGGGASSAAAPAAARAGRPGERLLAIEIKLNPFAPPEALAQTFPNVALDGWRRTLMRGQRALVPFLLNRVAFGEGNRRLRPAGPEDSFLTLWLRDGYTPLAWRSSVATLGADVRRVAALCHSVEIAAQELSESTKDDSLRAWLHSIRDVAIVVSSGLAGAADVAKLLGPEEEARWSSTFDDPEMFDAAVDLRSRVEALGAGLRKYRIN